MRSRPTVRSSRIETAALEAGPCAARRPTPCARRVPGAPWGLVAAALLGGCTGQLNTSNTLLAVDGEPAADDLPALRAADLTPDPNRATPSIDGLDRRHWPRTQVVVARGQVQAQPTYARTLLPDRSTARQRGDFPVGAEALDEHGDGGAEALSALASLAGTPLLLVFAPIEMIGGRWPWTTERPIGDYDRSPALPTSDPWVWIGQPGSPGAAPAPTAESGAAP